MSKIIYLKNGQKANLISDLGDSKYLVDPYEYYEGYNNGHPDNEPSFYEDVSGNLKIVSEFFNKSPKPVIEESFLKLQNEYDELKKSKSNILIEISAIKYELEKIKKENSDLEKWKIDLSQFKNAKRIIYFMEGKISPCIIDQEHIPKYKDQNWDLKFSINCHSGEVTTYSYGYYQYSDYRERNYNSDKIDIEYGYFFNLSDEEIIEIAKKRCSKMILHTFSSYDFREDNQIYFAQNAFDQLFQIKQKDKENSINNLKESIKKDQEQLLLLETKQIDILTISMPPFKKYK